MTWTYDDTDLNEDTLAGRKNVIRLLVQDTDTLNQLKSDEEIYYFLGSSSDNVYTTSYKVAQSIATGYAGLCDVEVDGQIREDLSQLMQNYLDLAAQLKDQAIANNATFVIAGGLSLSDRHKGYCEFDRVKPVFTKDQFR